MKFQLFRSKEYKCGDEILTIAAMTTVQVLLLLMFLDLGSKVYCRMFL